MSVNKKSKNWVDYKEIKDRVSMEMALAHYNLLGEMKKTGDNLISCCPIHKGSNSRQFSVDPKKNIFNCFGNCKSGGNVLDFVSKMESVSIREAALLLKGWFRHDLPAPKTAAHAKEPRGMKSRPEAQTREKPDEPDEKNDDRITVNPKGVNPPLNFELKTLKVYHPFFQERKISESTIKYFGLGYSNRGIMKDRIAIPIHNEKSELVAYCGRAVNDKQAKKDGKYRLPKKFVKSEVVYNLNRQMDDENCFIIVESFLSVYSLHQAGIGNTVAIMGSSLSERQEELIINRLGPHGLVILMFDADDSGEACTKDCLRRLSSRLFVKVLNISPYGKKPHHLTEDQLNRIFS